MSNNREYVLRFRANEKEQKIILDKCTQCNCNMSSYLRHMALNGNIIVYPEEEWRAIRRAISSVANNINQITVRYHYSTVLSVYYRNDLRTNCPQVIRSKKYRRLLP